MSIVFGTYGPKLKVLPKLVNKVVDAIYEPIAARNNFFRPKSKYAKDLGEQFKTKLRSGEKLYLLGISPEGHNTGVALVSVDMKNGINIICNNEEERFSAVKHTNIFPSHSINHLKKTMRDLNIGEEDIFGIFASWDFVGTLGFDLKIIFQHAPKSLVLMNPKYDPTFNLSHLLKGLKAPERLSKQLEFKKTKPFVGLHHHQNHAYFSYAASPFEGLTESVMVAVIDATGDNGAISLYEVKDGSWTCLRENESTIDSLGYLYGYISSTQGGWSFLSSEGRYMGAAAWGNQNRQTNPYYKRLRQILYFGKDGQILINRKMANWHIKSHQEPYAKELIDILGEPIKPGDMWDPDAVLNVDDVSHSEVTQERVDKAAALQMVFEDGFAHILDFLIKKTNSNKLVLTGGAALNCISNMRMLKSFDNTYYQRYIGVNKTLEMWVPPVPSDCGVALGAPFQFAMQNGAPSKNNFASPYLVGNGPSLEEIESALSSSPSIKSAQILDLNTPSELEKLAEFMVDIVEDDGVFGIFQGPGETGPRALGNRSILANPCNPKTLEVLNSKVKYREVIRPLAPMVTREEADRLFHLDIGAAANDYEAYNYMVLTVEAKDEAKKKTPAVVHYDGTSRIQIVRENLNPVIHAYLKAMGRRLGVEVSVNTSLNVGSPIVQTPAQALEVLNRAKAMDGIVLISNCGKTFAIWNEQNSASRFPELVARYLNHSTQKENCVA